MHRLHDIVTVTVTIVTCDLWRTRTVHDDVSASLNSFDVGDMRSVAMATCPTQTICIMHVLVPCLAVSKLWHEVGPLFIALGIIISYL